MEQQAEILAPTLQVVLEVCLAIIETETNTLIAGCKNTVIPESVKALLDGVGARMMIGDGTC